jgi:predicted transcriptional regulator
MTAFDRAWALVKQMGININDSEAPYTEMILDGEKTIETRRTNSLDPYVGEEVGIIRTGKGPAELVGFMDIEKPKQYNNSQEFDRDRQQHRVPKGSKEDKEGKSVGYPLTDVERTKPKEIHSRGYIAREI